MQQATLLYFFYFYLSKKIRLDVSCESHVMIHMKYQVLFYQKSNEKYSRLFSAVVVIGALRVNMENN